MGSPIWTAHFNLSIYDSTNQNCYSLIVVLPAFIFKISNPHTSIAGKIVAANRPVFRLPPAISERLPTIVGLTAAPRSPANAKNANIAVPPLGHFCDDMLIVPGHIIPTAKPQSAQPASPKIGNVDSDANK